MFLMKELADLKELSEQTPLDKILKSIFELMQNCTNIWTRRSISTNWNCCAWWWCFVRMFATNSKISTVLSSSTTRLYLYPNPETFCFLQWVLPCEDLVVDFNGKYLYGVEIIWGVSQIIQEGSSVCMEDQKCWTRVAAIWFAWKCILLWWNIEGGSVLSQEIYPGRVLEAWFGH